jgi:hypothetical protein
VGELLGENMIEQLATIIGYCFMVVVCRCGHNKTTHKDYIVAGEIYTSCKKCNCTCFMDKDLVFVHRMMKVRLKEKQPMFIKEFGTSDPVWFEAGEVFQVVMKKVMRHDNREWLSLKSIRIDQHLKGYHNPDYFEVISE